MVAPTGTATLDKTTYKPGEKMTLTVVYADVDTRPIKGSATLTNPDGSTSQAPFTGQIADPVTVTVSDPDRTWTRVSDDGSKAVFTATA